MTDRISTTNLWKRFVDGDDGAYVQLYNLYIDDLFAYGMCFTLDRASVEDCIQDVFVSLYRTRQKSLNVDNLKSYLFASLKHELYDLFKKSKEFYQIETNTS